MVSSLRFSWAFSILSDLATSAAAVAEAVAAFADFSSSAPLLSSLPYQ
jgi:hypothetical protein